MSETPWVYDDPDVPDDEVLYRRIPLKPSHCTFDAERGKWVPSVGAFQRGNPGEGMSVHAETVLEGCGRDCRSLYNPVSYAAVRFHASVPRIQGAGVLSTLPSEAEEPDADLRAAHAEVRPPTFGRDRPFWSRVRDAMIRASVWVQQSAG